MKTYLNIFFIFLIVCASCSNKKANDNRQATVPADTVRKFTLPVIPAILEDPELRAEYLVRNYWENVDLKDTSYIHHPEIMEQAWVDYIDIMRIVPADLAKSAIKDLIKSTEVEKKMFLYFTKLADKYLYDPNSPMRNEELYIPVLDAMLESNVLSDVEKIRPKGRRELAEKNRPGKKAIDFTYTLASGKTGTLYGVKAEYTVLFINNPGCHACEESIEEMKQAPMINKELMAGRLKILAVYPDEEKEEWERHLKDFPKEWINGYDKKTVIKEKNLYDLKAIPTLYLLDKDKNVLLKDVMVGQIEEYLVRRNAMQ